MLRPQLNHYIQQYEAFLDRIHKYRKKSVTNTDVLTSKSRPGSATLTLTIMMSATNPMASIPTGSTGSAQAI